MLREFAELYKRGHVRIVAEAMWPSRTTEEYPACVRNEALVNKAFRRRPVTILFPYDALLLSTDVLADAETTHPLIVDGREERVSSGYAPETMFDAYNAPLSVPPAESLTSRWSPPNC